MTTFFVACVSLVVVCRAMSAQVITGPWVLDSSIQMEARNLGGMINTPEAEYAPFMSADTAYLYFVRGGDHGKNHDIMVARRTSKDNSLLFEMPVALDPPINSQLNEGAITFSSDQRFAIFTACNRPDGMGDCDLYELAANDTGSVTMRNLSEINTRDWESQPSLSSDGYVLYYALKRPNAGSDIIICARQVDGKWGKRSIFERPINTMYNDDSPCVARGDTLLYFSSDRPGGYGGYDIYVSKRREDYTWEKPINLGPLFNSPKDDRFITVAPDGLTFYYSSTRTDLPHGGDFDIYVVRPVR